MKYDLAHMWAFWTYFPFFLAYVASLLALSRALKRGGVDIGFIFDVSNFPRLMQAIFTNRYTKLGIPNVLPLTWLVRVLVGICLTLLLISFVSMNAL